MKNYRANSFALAALQTAGRRLALRLQGERPSQRDTETPHEGGRGAAQNGRLVGEGKHVPGDGQGNT